MKNDTCFEACFPDPICRMDRELRVLTQNAASLERSGKRNGQPCHQVHFGLEKPCAGCQADWVLRTGQVSRWYLAVDTDEASGVKSYFEISLLPIRNTSGEITGLIEVFRDATLSIMMEQQLMRTSEDLDRQVAERTEQLERLKRDQATLVQAEKMASLGRLVAGLTHEIHTPLGTLVACMDLTRTLVRRTREDPRLLETALDEVDKLLELEDLASRRIGRILRSLREFAHLDRAEEEAADLHRGIDACLALLTHELGQRIEVVRDFGDLPLVVCRPDAMNQVFMNLLQNAVQAIQDEGVIRIVTRRVSEDEVRLEFHDTGCGIANDDLERIFDPGFTTKPRGVGTGLGLALSLNTMTTHAGSITVSSSSGNDTVFTLSLPLRGSSE